uniref:Uncharacterized protein n=1 Tax=Timema cristinae TaxID=61476 RepID=A0A7R9DFM5_TIMCR|nr:unnamed protein product [Timema cristinae]
MFLTAAALRVLKVRQQQPTASHINFECARNQTRNLSICSQELNLEINLNICDDNQSANEYDFKKALDLLKYVPDDLDRSELGHQIWCKSILRDDWTNADVNSPIDTVQKTIFFKIVDLIGVMETALPASIPLLSLTLSTLALFLQTRITTIETALPASIPLLVSLQLG